MVVERCHRPQRVGHQVLVMDLENRLREEERRRPDILAQPIERPIFIAGLPRSGTTFLHTLLAQDLANLVPRVWQLIHPYPLDDPPSGRDRRPQRVSRQLYREFAVHLGDAAGGRNVTEDTEDF